MVELDGVATAFDVWMPSIGLGSGDVTVRKIWQISPTKAYASVVVSAQAQPGPSTVTLREGLQLTTMPGGFQLLPANAGQLYVAASQMANPTPLPGSFVQIPLVNVASASPSTVTAVLTDASGAAQNLTVLGYFNGMLNALIPSNTAAGPGVLQVTVDSQRALPVILEIASQ